MRQGHFNFSCVSSLVCARKVEAVFMLADWASYSCLHSQHWKTECIQELQKHNLIVYVLDAQGQGSKSVSLSGASIEN